MAKKKGGKGAAAAAAAPVCNCEDPFKCMCGNRPERPSRGHKWDPVTKQWGGKGHKQKGAALGQAATVAKDKVITTEVGKTTLAPHQRLPSTILNEYCQKEKRKRPFYKEMKTKKAETYQYRLILPETAANKDDLLFVPAEAVGNAEQAKEEAALLALLHLTPTLPHERKLPDPYRTTWLQALETQKQAKKAAAAAANKKKSAPPSSAAASTANTTTSSADSKQPPCAPDSGGAKATSGLRSAVPVSKAIKEEERNEKRRRINAKIQKHEAIRLANQPHPVFMSAKLRQAIERILRHEKVSLENSKEEEEDEAYYENSYESEVQKYVEDRLHKEGFTRKQAREAFKNISTSSADEDVWEKVYEQALQWLLVHVDEENLPLSFDPRGGTLDVISASTKSSDNNGNANPKIGGFSQKYGLHIEDAGLICGEEGDPELVLWQTACRLAGVTPPPPEEGEIPDDDVINDELEALKAIFFEECEVNREKGQRTIVKLPLDGILTLKVTLDGSYPLTWPQSIVVESDKPWTQGMSLLVESAKFLSGDTILGEPMIFLIHGNINELVQSLEELPETRLFPMSTTAPGRDTSKQPASKSKPISSSSPVQRAAPPTRKRPREKSPFWSIPPTQTSPAIPFPAGAMTRARSMLPAAKARDDFLKALKKADTGSHVVLCTGETGCGKSTQLPQFILEEFPKEAKIVVCQPRRLAATGVANRVAEERGEVRPGDESVGYVVRGDSAICKSSRLVFCTTGVLLRQLQNDAALSCLTHIVIDEVHERNLDTDILLALLKQNIALHPHLRVVLMSATLDAERFLGYWNGETPSIHIPGRTFPVQDFHLEDVLALTKYIPSKRKKGNGGVKAVNNDDWEDEGDEDQDDHHEEEEVIQGHSVADLVKRIDETSINYDLLAILVRHLIQNKDPADDGSILIFLPGAPEIDRAIDAVKKVTRNLPVQLLALHGGLQPKEQNRVFQPAGTGLYKIVFSTNVAETSVTIPDCTKVIDTAREKQSSYDPSNRMPLLVEQFCSKASLKQRRGRAGRVRTGTAYRLISKATYNRLRDHSEPEIQRSALDQTLLAILFLGMECNASGGFMQTLLDPPSKASIEAAAFSLRSLGAMELTPSGSYSLTPLGTHLAGIPAPPVVGKILIMASILGCRQAGIAMAAGMSVGRSPFLRVDTRKKPRRHRGDEEPESMEEMKQKQILKERDDLFKKVGNSDHALLAAVYMEWDLEKAQSRKQFCEKLGLSFPGMRDVGQLANQFDSALRSLGYGPSPDTNRNGQSWRIIRAVATAGMAPANLVKVVRPATTYHETAGGAKEKDGEARELKFFIRTDGVSESHDETKAKEERVFVHPSSANFSTGSYSCPWLVYNSLVRTSKPFLRDVTECDGYPLLLFGGPIEVLASKDIVVVDGWCQLGAHARIGSLMGALRRRLDELLILKVNDPSYNIAASNEMAVIVKLIMTDGLGA